MPAGRDKRRARWASLSRPAIEGFLAVVLACLWTTSATAIDFDYDATRPQELKACDDPRHHGRGDAAKSCYEKLLRSSRDPSVQAEASWALGDVRQANDLFKAAVQADDKAVRARVRWGRLYLETHQYSDAADLFREALEINGDDVQARLAMARLLSDQFDGDARTVVNEVIEKSSERDRVQANSHSSKRTCSPPAWTSTTANTAAPRSPCRKPPTWPKSRSSPRSRPTSCSPRSTC